MTVLIPEAEVSGVVAQLRVWKWENGIPCALGVVSPDCTERQFIKMFSNAMPRKGEGKAQFRLRPVDMRGVEIGREFTVHISEHHSSVRKVVPQLDIHECPSAKEGKKLPSRYIFPSGEAGSWTYKGDVVNYCPYCGEKLPNSVLEELARVEVTCE